MRLFWWRPLRSATSLAFEAIHHSQAWLSAVLSSGRLLTNYGDELSPLVVEAVLGRRPVWAPPKSAQLFAIGSILQLAAAQRRRDFAVWGSGYRQQPAEVGAPMTVLAVRGTRSRAALGIQDVPLGDPGLLAGLLVGTHIPRRSGTLLIPHFTDWGARSSRTVIAHLRSTGVVVVHPASRVASVLDAVRRADVVLSSGLHGLVVADALGTPAIRVVLPGGSTQPDFKYADYESAFDASPQVLRLDGDVAITHIEAAHTRAAMRHPLVPALQEGLVRALEQSG